MTNWGGARIWTLWVLAPPLMTNIVMTVLSKITKQDIDFNHQYYNVNIFIGVTLLLAQQKFIRAEIILLGQYSFLSYFCEGISTSRVLPLCVFHLFWLSSAGNFLGFKFSSPWIGILYHCHSDWMIVSWRTCWFTTNEEISEVISKSIDEYLQKKHLFSDHL